MRKGQAAMEYLMTYGWAIIIIIVVIGALFAMGVFKTSGAVGCTPCFSNFAFVDYSAGTLIIKNGANEIDTIAVAANPDAVPLISADVAAADPGDDITISDIDTTGDIDITITYNHVTSGLPHTDTATIRN